MSVRKHGVCERDARYEAYRDRDGQDSVPVSNRLVSPRHCCVKTVSE